MSSAAVRDTLAQKASRLQRCIERAREEFQISADFANDLTRQDAAILNVQRACELAIDMANVVISDKAWDLPESARDAFARLHTHGLIDDGLNSALGRMVGFRNIAVHAYEKLDMQIVASVIQVELDSLTTLAALLLDDHLSH